MNHDYARALAGSLTSSGRPETERPGAFRITNELCVPLTLSWIEQHGAQWGFERAGRAAPGEPGHLLPGGQQVSMIETLDGYWWTLTTARSGAFAALAGRQASAEATYTGTEQVTIEAVDLVPPNALGHPPRSSAQRLVPGSSPRVLVACGMAPSEAPGSAISREQYWQLSGDSYSLVPAERRTVSFTETTGMESTTSTQETVAKSLGMSISAGWGPVSASVSASLSSSSTTFQQVSLSSEATTFVSREVENRSDVVELVLVWQLVEVITIFELDGLPLASTISSLNPAIVQSNPLHGPPTDALPAVANRLPPPQIVGTGLLAP
jgi:hypothetical protein